MLALSGLSQADEIRPGYLELKETSQNVFSVLWKVPAKGAKKLNIQAQLPDNCIDTVKPNTQLINAAYMQRWIVHCENGLTQHVITIEGLSASRTDVLLHLEFINGTSQTAQLTPTQNSYKIPTIASSFQISKTYTALGITHILFGFDHLLFVFALLFLVSGTRRLLLTITAFTFAHSITMAMATLGYVSVPQQPVEAIIALSIVFVAVEIIHGLQGRKGYAARWPWLIAFVFGLLHGFGFAGALAEIGLPQQAIPLALVFFNVGVEVGQVIFIAGFFTLVWLLSKALMSKLSEPDISVNVWKQTLKLSRPAAYVTGSLASFWMIERLIVGLFH